MLRIFSQHMSALARGPEPFSHEFLQWLRDLVRQVNIGSVPIGGVVSVYLTSDDLDAYFTSAVGNANGIYDGWAVCDGSDGRPDLINLSGPPAGTFPVPLIRVA